MDELNLNEINRLYVEETEKLRKNRNLSFQPSQQLLDVLIRKKLIERFPVQCGNVRLGISIGGGWLDPMAEACEKIQKLMDDNPGFIVMFLQIKEKLGGLRAYCRTFSIDENNMAQADELGAPKLDEKHKPLYDEVFKIICEAENKCDVRCEVCGEPGTTHHSTGYIHVACDKHAITKR
jgi:hypothetical protein